MNGSVWQRQHFLDMEENRWDMSPFDEEELGRDPFDEDTARRMKELEESGYRVWWARNRNPSNTAI